jgi:ribosome-associated protein
MTSLEIAIGAARVAEDKLAKDILIFDLREISDVADFFLIATADSKPQSRAITLAMERELKKWGVEKLGQEGLEGAQWVLLDYSEVVIHIFSPQFRTYYSLESLWGDAPVVAWDKGPSASERQARP